MIAVGPVGKVSSSWKASASASLSASSVCLSICLSVCVSLSLSLFTSLAYPASRWNGQACVPLLQDTILVRGPGVSGDKRTTRE